MAVTLQTGLRQRQKQVLNQTMIQTIEMLQLNTLELAAAINEALLNNPVLEESHDTSSEVNSEFSEITNRLNGDNSNYEHSCQERLNFADSSDTGYSKFLDDDNRKRMFIENTFSEDSTLQSHLISQLSIYNFTEKEKEIIQYIITSLDHTGLFRGDLAKTALNCGTDENIFEQLRLEVMKLDPPGCGALSVQEGLYSQALEKFPEDECLLSILDDCFGELTSLNYEKIAKKLNVTEDEVLRKTQLIKSLAPYPSGAYLGKKIQYVFPDIEVNYVDGEIIISFNDDWLPELKIDNYYSKLLKKQKNSEAKTFIQENINSAKSLITSINGRKETIFKIVNSIMLRQTDFLKKGPGNLKPLVYSTVSEDAGVHESTVSRVVNNKYIQTEWGVLPLKYFFVQKAEKSDNIISSDNVAKLVSDIVKNENPENPFSDDEIVKRLRNSDITIARRTVAKYREKLGIPSSSRRKRLNKINLTTEG